MCAGAPSGACRACMQICRWLSAYFLSITITITINAETQRTFRGSFSKAKGKQRRTDIGYHIGLPQLRYPPQPNPTQPNQTRPPRKNVAGRQADRQTSMREGRGERGRGRKKSAASPGPCRKDRGLPLSGGASTCSSIPSMFLS